MKIKNIFKLEKKALVKTNVEKLEKNQLEKVVGGIDNQLPTTETSDRVTSPMAGGGR